MRNDLPVFDNLLTDITKMIDDTRQRVVVTVNAELTMLYWRVGKRINDEVLLGKRAEYGKEVLLRLAERLTSIYGKGWSEKSLRHCLRSAEIFSEDEIVSAVQRQLNWTQIKRILYLKSDTERAFYLEMCAHEHWSSRQLDERINSLLYERTAISKKPEETILNELQKLRQEKKLSPDLVFRDPYF